MTWLILPDQNCYTVVAVLDVAKMLLDVVMFVCTVNVFLMSLKLACSSYIWYTVFTTVDNNLVFLQWSKPHELEAYLEALFSSYKHFKKRGIVFHIHFTDKVFVYGNLNYLVWDFHIKLQLAYFIPIISCNELGSEQCLLKTDPRN